LHPLVASAPLLTVGIAVLVARRPPVQAAGVGVLAAAVLYVWHTGFAFVGADLALLGTAVLVASVASVILPGLLFVEVTRHIGAAERLGNWVQALPGSPSFKAAVLVAALAPLLESLTGFGVSLIAVVPVALALLSREQALKVALLSMNIMPWGTLGLATLVGAHVAGLEPDRLGVATALTSALVFPLAAIFASFIASGFSLWSIANAACVGTVFSVTLLIANMAVGPAVSGVTAGFLTLLIALFFLRLRGVPFELPPAAIWPYAALFAVALLQRLVISSQAGLGEIVISSGGAEWAPLSSPGIALGFVAIIASQRTRLSANLSAMISRAIKPITALSLFILMAQLMREGDLIASLTRIAEGLTTPAAIAVTTIFGLASGYLTGSNVAGNALLMPAAAMLGATQDATILFSAVQNSAAGHAVLASVPIVALLASLAHADAAEQARLLRFGFMIVLLNGMTIFLVGLSARYLGLFEGAVWN